MNSPVHAQGRIGEQHTAYRRGLVLGLTMAEVGILIIFVLLLLLALGALEKQRRSSESRGKELVSSERLKELQADSVSLHAIARAVGAGESATPEEIQELVGVVQENSGQARANLEAVKAAQEDIRRAQEEIRRIANRASAGSGEDLVKMVEAQSRALANKEGQLQYAEKRLSALGEGNGARPCWVEPDGSVVFLYDVILISAGIRMKLRPDIQSRGEFSELTFPEIDSASVLSEEDFLARTRGLYEYGQRDQNRCRFHVYVWDGTEPAEKELYKRLLRTVEGHFYKQYRVPNGIPF